MLAEQFLQQYYGEGAFGVQGYLDVMGGAEAASHFYLQQYNPLYDNPATPGFLAADYLTPSSVLESARGLTAARQLVAAGTDTARAAVLTRRMDAAKMPVYLVVMFRWAEMRAFANRTRQAWPLNETTLTDTFLLLLLRACLLRVKACD